MVKTATDIPRNPVGEMRLGAEDLKTKIADLADDLQKHTGAKVVSVDGGAAADTGAAAVPLVKPVSL